mmetsp:Transcript_14564/g.45790  ORF Transcript_14564/g.45790 Transcript_14564/m.45790 type:complete len:209 (-) Transcript_14564:158-784(-)
MNSRNDLEFNVRWYPFQLNPRASQEPSSKMQAYAQKFGKSEEEVMAMGEWMKQKFDAVGLPYSFTKAGLVANTFEAHRVLTAAYKKGGTEAQDRAAEKLFHGYFADEKAPNDPGVLKEAAAAAGLDGEAFVADASAAAAETESEFEVGRRLRVSGVPHFVISMEDGSGRPVQVSGAQPPEEFKQVFEELSRPQPPANAAAGQPKCDLS